MVEITDRQITFLKNQAELSLAIELAYKTLGEIAAVEAHCRQERIKFELLVGELIAQKMMMERVADRL